MNTEEYKNFIIKLINKTNDPTAPIRLKEFQNGVEHMAKLVAPLCNKTSVNKLSKRLLKDFSNKDLESEIGKSPEFILALLAIVKTATIEYTNNL